MRAGDFLGCKKALDEILLDNPDEPEALFILTAAILQSGEHVLGYHMAKRMAEKLPRNPTTWANMIVACHKLWKPKEAMRAFKKGLPLCRDDEDRKLFYLNMGAISCDSGNPELAKECALKVLEIDPDNDKAKGNLGFAKLCLREKDAYQWYRCCLGKKDRPEKDYGAPWWEGQEGRVVIYGEQGIGDTVSFGELVHQACERADILIDVEPRLVGLFKRSFPKATVTSGYEGKPDYQMAMGQLGELFERTGEPFLSPDMERVRMWDYNFAGQRPVYGIAWSGGTHETGKKFRTWTEEQTRILIDAHPEAIWVSLQYDGSTIEGVRDYSYATKSRLPYDDCAALVASLDRVFAMQTAVVHLAGGLGIPVTVFVPSSYCMWRYYHEEPWYKSMNVVRQKNDDWTVTLRDFVKEDKCQRQTLLRPAS